MKYILLQNIVNIVHVIVLLYVIIRSYRMITGGSKSVMMTVFFIFSAAALFMEDLYWIAYDFLRPGTRMPIAANEIAEAAAFLMLSAVLTNAISGGLKPAAKELACAALFVVCSIALWIAWTGEWVQDILGGAAFGYLFCRAVWAMKLSEALCEKEWKGLGFGALLLILGEVTTFFLEEPYKQYADIGCYFLMYIIVLFFLRKNIIQFRQFGKNGGKADPDAWLSLSVAYYAWSLSCMYMSDGWYYLLYNISSLISIPLMLFALEKEMEKEMQKETGKEADSEAETGTGKEMKKA